MKSLVLITVFLVGPIVWADATLLIQDPDVFARIETAAKEDATSEPPVKKVGLKKKRKARSAATPSKAGPSPTEPIKAAVAAPAGPRTPPKLVKTKRTPPKITTQKPPPKVTPPVAIAPTQDDAPRAKVPPPLPVQAIKPLPKIASVPNYPRCSSRALDVEAMMKDKLGTSMLEAQGYREEGPQGAMGSVRLLKDKEGSVQVVLLDGSNQIIGVVPASFCSDGSSITASLRRAGINFGTAWGGLIDKNSILDERLTKYQGRKDVFIIDLTRTTKPGVIHVADRMKGEAPDERIDGDFSPVAR